MNVQGEQQKKLDGKLITYVYYCSLTLTNSLVVTNNILKNALKYSGKVGTLASEEEDVPINIEKTPKYVRGDEKLQTTQFNSAVLTDVTSDYVAVFDPLDGSSNVDAGIPTGTIFGIFEGIFINM